MLGKSGQLRHGQPRSLRQNAAEAVIPQRASPPGTHPRYLRKVHHDPSILPSRVVRLILHGCRRVVRRRTAPAMAPPAMTAAATAAPFLRHRKRGWFATGCSSATGRGRRTRIADTLSSDLLWTAVSTNARPTRVRLSNLSLDAGLILNRRASLSLASSLSFVARTKSATGLPNGGENVDS